ncbi:MAG: hypothetical protein PHP82_04335, partial [Candidatus ainarchaeum sp.]|nr:hypothetical protein [Candidatus ainarchaeum sp.]
MNSKILIVLISFFVLISFNGVNALTINGPSSMSLCQCDTEAQTFSVCADITGNYSVSVSGLGAKWVEIAPSTLNINAGSCKDFFVFVTPECYAISGSFPFTINVAGELDNESKNVSLFVEQCHTFNFNVTPEINNSNPCEKNTFNISIANTGKFTDEFVLLQKGLGDSWVSYPRESFVLGSGESLNTSLFVESLCSTPSGSYPFTLTLSNTKTNASSTRNLVQGINNFTSLTNDLSTNISVCSEEKTNFDVLITNNSNRDDEVEIIIEGENFISVDKKILYLAPQETKKVVLSVNPVSPQTTEFIFSMKSNNYDSTFSKNVNLVINDCYNVSIERIGTQENYCLGNVSQKYLVTNNGTKNIDVNISVTGVNVEPKKVNILSGLSEEIVFSFSEQEGSKNIVVSAETNFSKDTINYTLNFENCYGAELLVPEISVCSTEKRIVDIKLKNNGTQQQTFNVSTNADWIIVNNSEMSVEPNSEKIVSLSLDVPQQIESEYLITAVSDNSTLTRTLQINALSEEFCYSFEVIKNNDVIDVNCCDGAIKEIILKNTGNFVQDFSIRKIAPEWVSFSHTQVSLNPNEEKIVYVYFAPPIGTNGQLIGTIEIKNQKNLSKTFDFNLNVFGGSCGVGLNADLNVNGEIALTKIFTRKEIDVEFNITNDSNVGFNVVD